MICKLCAQPIVKESEDYLKLQGFHLGNKSGDPEGPATIIPPALPEDTFFVEAQNRFQT